MLKPPDTNVGADPTTTKADEAQKSPLSISTPVFPVWNDGERQRLLKWAPAMMEKRPDILLKHWANAAFVADPESAVDQFDALQAYHNEFEAFAEQSPLLEPEALTQLIISAHKGVRDAETEHRLLISGLRWTTNKEKRDRIQELQKSLQCKREMAAEQPSSSPPRKDSANPHSPGFLTPKDSLHKGLKDPSSLEAHAQLVDPDGSYRDWLRDVLVEDINAVLDPHDVLQALELKHVSKQDLTENTVLTRSGLSLCCIYALVTGAHSTATLRQHTNTNRLEDLSCRSMFNGLRYRVLHSECTNNISIALPHPFSERWQTDAHKLLYVPQPDRMATWLKMNFRADTTHAISVVCMVVVLKQSFSRSRETHVIYGENASVDCILETFRGSEKIEVSDGHFMIQGVTLRPKPIPVEVILARHRQRAFQRLANKGLIEGPPQGNNEFTRKLLEDPLVPLPDNRIGPVYARLWCRARGAPLGDVEPGFPGVSMKRIQKMYKQMCEEFLESEDEARAQRWDQYEEAEEKRIEEAEKMVKEEIEKRERNVEGGVKGDKRPTAAEWKKAADELLTGK